MPIQPRRLFLYSTCACHLCETARELITPCLDGLNITLEEVDISASPELMERYGIRIPVIRLDGRDHDLGWPFTEEQFLAFVKTATS